MTDTELIALVALVESSSRQMRIADEERFRNNHAPAYGDCSAQGESELAAPKKVAGKTRGNQ